MYSVRIYFFMITNNKYYFNSINYNLIISLENLLINSKGFIILFKVLVDKAIGYNWITPNNIKHNIIINFTTNSLIKIIYIKIFKFK